MSSSNHGGRPVDPGSDSSSTLTRVDQGAAAFIRARPVTCLVCAVALGFLVGKIAARA